jgi:type I restriction-modification system DNA methylase subunit/restriction endonuclease S subunit
MGRSTVHYADSETNNILKRLHNKLRPAGTPVERVEYIIELLLLRIFEAKIKQDEIFTPLRKLFEEENYRLLFSHLLSLNGEQILSELNKNIFPFYSAILSKARTVITGNLPQKMQDQLVLMEEVFANSNFTNNVKGGVIAEVIGMVNEIDEKYILKTDLLGDAIESALSETGGTKDLGLYRTPDHIRQMMVEMVDPDFTDTIFDPACGTAGFLFDAYDYVIEKARKTRQFPAEHIANIFYRTGISGIEYQGRIRKMAAVNMHIRGLNPHNINQGDSLKMFDPSRDAGSKSIVIANPPFGAERDQPAYPNIWEEYSKESETTILFVKLMFDLLKKGGRCAVIVSEGFLTWRQNSACALRKILLSEANLRAIISLPQGVFVSKSGQGAKTSILYFEKGQPTDFVWYYKIENDGFSMGTNRKHIEGGQIPELLEYFKEVKQGKKSRDTSRSFCISKEQIESLDPRISERIKKEVSEKTKEKNVKKREKLIADLNEKLESKKINKEMYDEKLWQFDNIIEGQIDNEIAKALEKAHSYHFNLQNYRSNLSAEQVKDWRDSFKGVEIKNGSTIEKRFQELQKTEPKTALQILASFDPKDALQVDITREYLSKLDKEILEQDGRLKKLKEILKKGYLYPIALLGDLIILNNEKIKPTDFQETEFTVLGVSNQAGVFINEKLKGEDIKQTYYKVYKNQFCYNPYRINVGSIGFCEFDIQNQIISGAYNVFGCNESELNPKYLDALFKTKKFLLFVNDKANGGVRMDFKIEYMQEWQIPLPPLDVQNEIVEKIEKQKQIVDGAEQIEENFQIQDEIFNGEYKKRLIDVCELITDGTHQTPEYTNDQNGIKFLSATSVSGNELKIEYAKRIPISLHEELKKRVLPREDDILMAKNGTIGRCKLLPKLNEEISIYVSLALLRPNQTLILPKYLYYIIQTKLVQYQLLLRTKKHGGVGNLHLDEIREVEIPLPILEVQRQIVEKLDRQMQALEGVQLLKAEAEKKINEILEEVWGGEF